MRRRRRCRRLRILRSCLLEGGRGGVFCEVDLYMWSLLEENGGCLLLGICSGVLRVRRLAHGS